MSDDNLNQNDAPKKRLVKVKRLKNKNNAAPQPETPVYEKKQMIQTFIPEDPLTNSSSEENLPDEFVSEYDYPSENADLLTEQPLKMIILASLCCFIAGFGLAKFLDRNTSSGTAHEGLQGVVVNPEVPKGKPRCGLVDKTQGCVLYIMNPQRQDLNARDFYDLASQLTGRQRFVIDTANMRYSNTKIRPGAIVQINIPSL